MLNCFIRMLRFSVLDPNNKSPAEMYAEMDALTNQEFQQILAEFRQNIKADILVVGNVTPKVGSIKIINYDYGTSNLCKYVNYPSSYKHVHVVKLSKRRYRYIFFFNYKEEI